MTLSADTPRLVFDDIAAAVRELRGRGLRLTTPRRLVLEALFATEGPVSAEHLAQTLTLDITSVYRNLETLESHGLAQHVHLGHGPGLYVLVGHGEHGFLSCERCGAARTLSIDELEPIRARVEALFGYQARFTHFPIVGLCPACAAAPAGSASATPRTADGAIGATGESAMIRKTADTGHRGYPGGPGPHEHEHNHGGYVHSHSHAHQADAASQHEHGHSPRRSPPGS